MALLNIFDIAGSAMTAQSQRLNVSASNLANADSVTGPDGQPYVAKQVVFQTDAAAGAATGGVKVAQVVDDPTRRGRRDQRARGQRPAGDRYRTQCVQLRPETGR